MIDTAGESNDNVSFLLPEMILGDWSDSSSVSIVEQLPESEDIKSEKCDQTEEGKFDKDDDKERQNEPEFTEETLSGPSLIQFKEFDLPEPMGLPVISEKSILNPGSETLPPLSGAAQYITNTLPSQIDYIPVDDNSYDVVQLSDGASRGSFDESELPNHQFLMSSKSASQGPSSRLDFAYLTAHPLVIEKDGLTKIQILNSGDEWKAIEQVIQKSEIKLRYEKAIATTESLQRVLNLGCRVLHISGYGLQHRLIFEDEEKLGLAQVISTSSLRKLLDALITNQRWLELVVVSACHSYFAGKTFLDNGIKSVVCVKYDTTIDDNAAQTFSSSFYNSLFSQKELTVCKAFDAAKARIEIAHSGGENKYMLLQDDKDHKVVWYRSSTAMDRLQCENLSTEPHANCLPKNPSRVGREIEMQFVLRELNKNSQKRVVVVHSASKGSGKRAFALMLAHWLSERSTFAFDRIFFFEKGNLAENKDAPRKGKAVRKNPIWSQFAYQFLNKQNNWSPEQKKILKEFYQGKSRQKFMSVFPRKFVQDQKWLIIIDHLSDIEEKQQNDLKEFFNSLLQACEGIKLLITCRDSKVVLLLFEKWSRFAYELPLLSTEEAAELFYLSLPTRFEPSTFGYYNCKNVTSEIVPRLEKERYIKLMKGIPGLIKSEALQILPPRLKKPPIFSKLDRDLKDHLKRIVYEVEEESRCEEDIREFVKSSYTLWKIQPYTSFSKDITKGIFEYLYRNKFHLSKPEMKSDDGRSERSRKILESFSGLSSNIQQQMYNVINKVFLEDCENRMKDLIDGRYLKHHNTRQLPLGEIYQYFSRNWIEKTVFNETERIEKKARKWYRKFDFAHVKKLELDHLDNPSIERVLFSIKKRLKDEGIIKEREYDTYFEDYWYDKLYISFRDHPQLKGRLRGRTTLNAKDWKAKRKQLMEETIPIANVLQFHFFYVEKNIPIYRALHKYIDQKDPIILYGFITRQQAEALVRTCQRHTFIIRFSTRKEGLVLTVFKGKQGMTPYKHFQFDMEIMDASEKEEITFTACRRAEKSYIPYRTNNFVKLVKDLPDCKYLYACPPSYGNDKSNSLGANTSHYSKYYTMSLENYKFWRIPKNLIFTDNPESCPA